MVSDGEKEDHSGDLRIEKGISTGGGGGVDKKDKKAALQFSAGVWKKCTQPTSMAVLAVSTPSCTFSIHDHVGPFKRYY